MIKKALILLIVVFGIIYIFYQVISNYVSQEDLAGGYQDGLMKATGQADTKDALNITDNLFVPWEIIPLKRDRFLFTERSGDLVYLKDGELIRHTLENVQTGGEGGLLGMVIDASFEETGRLYLYYSYKKGEIVINRVQSFLFNDEELKEENVIVDDIPYGIYHNGGRLAFGPDGYLYITTGDAGSPNLAQDKDSLAGKILRIGKNGSIPLDNPFGNPVYSLGHRNPQGIAWDDDNNLYSVDHGRSGLLSGFDELNLVVKGGNYGWPVVQGGDEKEDMYSPLKQSGPDTTWAPSGLAYYKGRLYFTGLKGESLYSYDIFSSELFRDFTGRWGRLRAVKIEGGSMYFATSNRDGRGNPNDDDDKIIRIDASRLNKS